VVVDSLENVRVDLPAAVRTSHRCNASRARDACSHAPSRTSHAARRLALTALLPHAALDQLVAPERLVGAAEQRARFEQLAPPQQLLRFAVQQLRLQLNPPCSVRRKAAAGVRPAASAAYAVAQPHARGWRAAISLRLRVRACV
jgi:hypothetical protein